MDDQLAFVVLLIIVETISTARGRHIGIPEIVGDLSAGQVILKTSGDGPVGAWGVSIVAEVHEEFDVAFKMCLLVKPEMDLLVELGWALLAVVGLVPTVESHVCLEVAGTAKSLLADVTAMRLLPRVNKMMLLKMSELCEALPAKITGEGFFTGVDAEVDLEVRQLPKFPLANVAFVDNLAVAAWKLVAKSTVTVVRVTAAPDPPGNILLHARFVF